MAGSPSRSIPRSPSAPARKGKPPARGAAKPTLLGRVIARPGVIVAGATFAAVMTGIVVNAMLFQKGHHPSPLFGPAQTETIGAEPTRSVPPAFVPVPIPRQVIDPPAQPAPAVEQPAPAPTAPTQLHPARVAAKAVKHAAAPSHKAASPKEHKDLIGQLLGKTQPKGN